MKIDIYFDEFIKSKQFKYDKDLRKTAKTLLKGDKAYCLPKQGDYIESEYLADYIKSSVMALPRGKESAIKVYKKLIAFLKEKGIEVSIEFPRIPIENSFERQMFIAKYLQDKNAKISDLKDKLWVSDRTIDQDLQRLYRGSDDPIQICGRPFFIPDSVRSKDQIHSASTAHPLFLTENLTQVIIMLQGLHVMAEDPIKKHYAEATAADIWEQLSDYAKKRIRFVLDELLPEEIKWYEKLENKSESFYTEQQCSIDGNAWMYCFKNEIPFHIEYKEDDEVVIYKNCFFVHGSYRQAGETITFEVDCDKGKKTICSDRILRSTRIIEELAGD